MKMLETLRIAAGQTAINQGVGNMKNGYLIYAFGIDMKKKAWKETMNEIDFIRLQNIPVYEQYLT